MPNNLDIFAEHNTTNMEETINMNVAECYPDGCNLCGGNVSVTAAKNRGLRRGRGFHFKCDECGAESRSLYNGNPRPLIQFSGAEKARHWVLGAAMGLIDLKRLYEGQSANKAHDDTYRFISKKLGKEIESLMFLDEETCKKVYSMLIPDGTPEYLKIHYRYYNTVVNPNRSWVSEYGLQSGLSLLSDILFLYEREKHFLLLAERVGTDIENRIVVDVENVSCWKAENATKELASSLFELGLDFSYAPRSWIKKLPADYKELKLSDIDKIKNVI